MDKETRSLSDAGWEVVVILAHDHDEMVGGIRVVGVHHQPRRFARITIGAFQSLLAALRESADVYHFHDPELIPVGLLLRALRKKVVYDVHETNWATVAYKTYLPRWSRPAIAWFIRNFELTASRYFSGIVAATPKISDQFKRIRTPRVTVQNFPKLNSDTLPRPWHSRSHAAIYAGVITEGRGLLAMVDAMDLLPDSIGAQLILAGPIAPETLARVQTRAGWRRVKALGPFRAVDLPELLSNAKVGLVVLQPMTNYLDSYPTKMFEYMAAGLPVIASDFPLWRSIMGDNDCGIFVDPLNPADIARAIEYLVTNDAAAKTMGLRARAMVLSNYNWETEGRKLVSFYNALRPVKIEAYSKGITNGHERTVPPSSHRS